MVLLLAAVCFAGAAFLLFCLIVMFVAEPLAAVLFVCFWIFVWKVGTRGNGRWWPNFMYADESEPEVPLPANHISSPKGRSSLDEPPWPGF